MKIMTLTYGLGSFNIIIIIRNDGPHLYIIYYYERDRHCRTTQQQLRHYKDDSDLNGFHMNIFLSYGINRDFQAE